MQMFGSNHPKLSFKALTLSMPTLTLNIQFFNKFSFLSLPFGKFDQFICPPPPSHMYESTVLLAQFYLLL